MSEQFGLVCLPMQAAAPVSKILMELATGVEPATCSLQVSCSAIEPRQHTIQGLNSFNGSYITTTLNTPFANHIIDRG